MNILPTSVMCQHLKYYFVICLPFDIVPLTLVAGAFTGSGLGGFSSSQPFEGGSSAVATAGVPGEATETPATEVILEGNLLRVPGVLPLQFKKCLLLGVLLPSDAFPACFKGGGPWDAFLLPDPKLSRPSTGANFGGLRLISELLRNSNRLL